MLFVTIGVNAQTPNWLWAKSACGSGNGVASVTSITVDASGNSYITGYFQSDTITFGSFTLANDTNNSYTPNIFLAKYDANGNVLWARSAVGKSSVIHTGDEALSVAVDILGNAYITGYFTSTSITFGSTTLSNSGSTDIFLTKYDINGNVLWAKTTGGTSYYNDVASSVVVDASGNAYITGNYYDTIIFASDTLKNTSINPSIFLTKYDANGNVIWAEGTGGTSGDDATSVTVDVSGNIYLTGYFGAGDNGNITFGTDTLINAGEYDIFLAKYNTNGNVLWASSAGGTGEDMAYSLATDTLGNVYVTGYFDSPSIIFGSTTLTNSAIWNIFLTKYNASGTVVWARNVGGIGNNYAYSVAVDALGNTYVAGNYNSSDTVLEKYDTAGNKRWAESEGGAGVTCVAVDNSENTYVAGLFKGKVFLGSDTLTNTNLNYAYIYLAKFNCDSIITEIKELANSFNISVYPNPNTGEFQIKSPNYRVSSIEIYNVLGKKVYSTYNFKQTTTNEIDISDWPSGIYVVEARIGNSIVVKKFVKE